MPAEKKKEILSEDDLLLRRVREWEKIQQEKNRYREAGTLGRYVDRFVKKTGLRKKSLLPELIGAWEKTVPPEICRQTTPVKLQKGVATIAVSSSALKTELESFYAEALLADLREQLPDKILLRKITFIFSAEAR
jgi:predicted nucleic acid-binding Zn ribbon protein